MKKFQFSLAALLSLREEQTRKCEFLLAAEIGKLAMVKNQMESVNKDKDRALFSARADLNELRMRELLLRRALNERRALRTQLVEGEKKVEKARHTYFEARSKSVALEKLRRKRKKHWKLAVRQEEMKNLDEIAKGLGPRLDASRGKG